MPRLRANGGPLLLGTAATEHRERLDKLTERRCCGGAAAAEAPAEHHSYAGCSVAGQKKQAKTSPEAVFPPDANVALASCQKLRLPLLIWVLTFPPCDHRYEA